LKSPPCVASSLVISAYPSGRNILSAAPDTHRHRQTRTAPARLLTSRAWSIFRHSLGFFDSPACLDSNTCSILTQSFETRNESQGRQRALPLAIPLCLRATNARSPTALGLTAFHIASISQARKAPVQRGSRGQKAAFSWVVTSKAQQRKSHIFSSGPPCLFLKQVFEFRSFV
jgi:hypothetical protein